MPADCANELQLDISKNMTKVHEAEKRFEEYRDNLRREVGLLADYVHLFRGIQKLKKRYVFEINYAPAFFSLITKSVFSTIILWVDKLLDEKGQRGVFDFLRLVEASVDIFAIEALKCRRKFPDDYWVLRERRKEGELTIKHVVKDRERLRNLRCLQSITTRRDKYHAHFDKEYFFDLHRLDRDAPVAVRDLGNAVRALWSILNKYSAAYDGTSYPSTAANINDVERILRHLREFRKHQREGCMD